MLVISYRGAAVQKFIKKNQMALGHMDIIDILNLYFP
jgi:hypothetical protein